MRLAEALGSRERSRERGPGLRSKFGNHLRLGARGTRAAEGRDEGMVFHLLSNMRSVHSVSPRRDSGSFLSGGVGRQQGFQRVVLGWGRVNWGKLRGVDVYSGTRRARPALGCQSRHPGLPAPGGFHHSKWVRTSLPVCSCPHTDPLPCSSPTPPPSSPLLFLP